MASDRLEHVLDEWKGGGIIARTGKRRELTEIGEEKNEPIFRL